MPKQKHFMVADTETIGLGNRAIVFDFGYCIATRRETVKERSFLVREVITNPHLMFSAIADNHWRESFGGKLFNFYIPELDANNARLFNWREIIETVRDDMHTFGVDVFSAYNLPFDSRALAKTQKLICDGGKVLDYRPDLLCLWDFACSTVCNTQLYHDVARELGEDNGWITPAGNVRTTAEKTYAFLSGDLSFIESHTALHDAQIETEILQRLLAKKKPIPYNNPELYHPWRRAQRVQNGSLF